MERHVLVFRGHHLGHRSPWRKILRRKSEGSPSLSRSTDSKFWRIRLSCYFQWIRALSQGRPRFLEIWRGALALLRISLMSTKIRYLGSSREDEEPDPAHADLRSGEKLDAEPRRVLEMTEKDIRREHQCNFLSIIHWPTCTRFGRGINCKRRPGGNQEKGILYSLS